MAAWLVPRLGVLGELGSCSCTARRRNSVLTRTGSRSEQSGRRENDVGLS